MRTETVRAQQELRYSSVVLAGELSPSFRDSVGPRQTYGKRNEGVRALQLDQRDHQQMHFLSPGLEIQQVRTRLCDSVVGILLIEAAIMRLVGAMTLERKEWRGAGNTCNLRL